jgi:hypothetical protein
MATRPFPVLRAGDTEVPELCKQASNAQYRWAANHKTRFAHDPKQTNMRHLLQRFEAELCGRVGGCASRVNVIAVRSVSN